VLLFHRGADADNHADVLRNTHTESGTSWADPVAPELTATAELDWPPAAGP
jgi:hypothetical protein